MLTSRSALALFATAIVLSLAAQVRALEKCKANIKGKDGTIKVQAKDVQGPLMWGNELGQETETFFNAGTCLAGTKAKKCVFGDEGTLARITPPAGCIVYLADGVGPPCSAYIKKCIPGVRSGMASLCGNGVIDPGEDCEAGNLNGETCASQAFFNGDLACGAGCRFDTVGCAATHWVDNGDGTVTDNLTHLTWEKKTGTFGGLPVPVDPHEVDNEYTWCANVDGQAFDCDDPAQPRDGTAYGDFLSQVNGRLCPAFNLTTPCPGLGGYSDWRIPTLEELKTLLLEPFSCSTSPCIDAIFGPTAPATYWSSSERLFEQVWFVDFANALVGNNGFPGSARHTRAVRGP